MTKNELKQICEAFTAEVLGDYKCDNKCYTLCLSLSLYLAASGIESIIDCGRFRGKSHYWLRVDKLNIKVLDPSVRQFSPLALQVYGTSAVYVAEKADPDYFSEYNDQERLDGAFNKWEEPFFNDGEVGLEEDDNHELTPVKIDLHEYITVNFRAAEMVLSKFKAKGIFRKEVLNYEKYFSCISEIVRSDVVQYGIDVRDFPILYKEYIG